jgi:hypothetical protein
VTDPVGGPETTTARPAPVTGEEAVDQALAELSDLDAAPLSEHHERLAHAHDALHQVLHPQEPA